MKIELKAYLYILFTLFCLKSWCQQKNEIGIDFQSESMSKTFKTINQAATKTTQSKVIFSPLLIYQRQLTLHSSLELGLKYRQVFSNATVLVALGSNSNNQLNFAIKEKFLNLPILYKFNSKFIAFSLGPTVEYFLGAYNSKNYSLGKEFYSDKWSWGLLAKISKQIKLDKRIIFEPSLFYNSILSFNRNFLGISIATKYKF